MYPKIKRAMQGKLRYYRHLKKFLKLIRWNNLVIIFITQVFVKIFIIDIPVVGRLNLTIDFFILNISTLFIAAAGYIINDYYDIKIDLLNRPGKLVVGKFISRRIALTLHLSLTVIGIILGFYNGYLIGLLHVISAFTLWLYSNNLKRLPLVGNISIALLSGLSVFLVAVFYRRDYEMIFNYALFAFYISVIREIIKDMEDFRGDSAFGCKTLPILWGFRKTKRLITYIMVLFTANIFVLFYHFPVPAILYLLGAVVVPLGYLWMKLNRADTLKEYKALSFYCKLIMGTGLGSILLLN